MRTAFAGARYHCNGYFPNEFRAERGNNANEATRPLKLDIKEFKKIVACLFTRLFKLE